MENKTPPIFCPRNEAWENSLDLQIEKLKQENPFLVLTAVNIEQIEKFNCLPQLPDSKFTGIIIEKNQIFNCYPFTGNAKTFKAEYPDGIIWIAQKEKRKEIVEN